MAPNMQRSLKQNQQPYPQPSYPRTALANITDPFLISRVMERVVTEDTEAARGKQPGASLVNLNFVHHAHVTYNRYAFKVWNAGDKKRALKIMWKASELCPTDDWKERIMRSKTHLNISFMLTRLGLKQRSKELLVSLVPMLEHMLRQLRNLANEAWDKRPLHDGDITCADAFLEETAAIFALALREQTLCGILTKEKAIEKCLSHVEDALPVDHPAWAIFEETSISDIPIMADKSQGIDSISDPLQEAVAKSCVSIRPQSSPPAPRRKTSDKEASAKPTSPLQRSQQRRKPKPSSFVKLGNMMQPEEFAQLLSPKISTQASPIGEESMAPSTPAQNPTAHLAQASHVAEKDDEEILVEEEGGNIISLNEIRGSTEISDEQRIMSMKFANHRTANQLDHSSKETSLPSPNSPQSVLSPCSRSQSPQKSCARKYWTVIQQSIASPEKRDRKKRIVDTINTLRASSRKYKDYCNAVAQHMGPIHQGDHMDNVVQSETEKNQAQSQQRRTTVIRRHSIIAPPENLEEQEASHVVGEEVCRSLQKFRRQSKGAVTGSVRCADADTGSATAPTAEQCKPKCATENIRRGSSLGGAGINTSIHEEPAASPANARTRPVAAARNEAFVDLSQTPVKRKNAFQEFQDHLVAQKHANSAPFDVSRWQKELARKSKEARLDRLFMTG